MTEDGQEIMALLIKEVKRRLSDPEIAHAMAASELEFLRKLLADNSVTFASVQAGNFGDTAKEIAEQFPFTGDEEAPTFN